MVTRVKTTKKSLRRFTSTASTIDMLTHSRLTLLSPKSWDDKSDAYALELYRDHFNLKNVLALCFTQSGKTFHHWKVFAGSSDGVCIEFDKKKVIEDLDKIDGLEHGAVEYKTQSQLENSKIDLAKIAFIKRKPYAAENEYRFVYKGNTQDNVIHVPISLTSIKSITLSPWFPEGLVDIMKGVFNSCCKNNVDIKILHSKLLISNKWNIHLDVETL